MAIQFNDLKKPSPSRVLIIDALNLGFRWKHQQKTNFIDEYVRTVNSLADSYRCGTIIIAGDKGSSKYRKGIYPEYKQDRKEKYAKQSDEEKLAFEVFFLEMQNIMDYFSEKEIVLQYEGVEADDIAGYLSSEAKVDHMWLISSDRDWDLLVSPKVSRFSYINRKESTFNTWAETHDFSIDDYITIKCLTGDKGDNIPGIPGIGEKRATSLVKEYGNIFDIYDACPIDSKYKYIQTLNDNKEVLLRNFELMDLKTYAKEAIGEENILDINYKCDNIL